MSRRGPDSRDIDIGRRVRTFRLQKGLSQEGLAHRLGITFQQVQKYEKGTNRIGAGRLQHIAEILAVPIVDFFNVHAHRGSALGELAKLLDTTPAVRLIRAYARIRNRSVQRALTQLVESIAGR